MLDWDTPVDGGECRSPHALEIGFVFDNLAKSESMSGIGPEQQRIADLMSSSWLAFAGSCHPNNRLVTEVACLRCEDTALNGVRARAQNRQRHCGKERRLFDSMKMGENG